jgi:hypothetical protein
MKVLITGAAGFSYGITPDKPALASTETSRRNAT